MKTQPNDLWRSQQGLRAPGVEGCGADSGACATAQTPSVHDIFNFSDGFGLELLQLLMKWCS